MADPLPQQEQARREAVAACRRQAEQLADAAGATLGALVSLDEGGRPDVDAHVVHLSARPGMRASGMPVEGGVLEVAVVVTGPLAAVLTPAGEPRSATSPVGQDQREVQRQPVAAVVEVGAGDLRDPPQP